MTRRSLLAVCVAVAALATTARPVSTQAGEKLRITAWAVNMSNIGTGGNAMVEILIDGWSPPEERSEVIAAMEEGGQEALLRTLEKLPPKGRMRFPGWVGPDPLNASLGWDLKYTEQSPLPDGGRRIAIMFDRYLTFWEVRNRPRTTDYPFTFIEVRVNKNGEGEGKMSALAKINFDKRNKVIVLEDFGSEPLRLQQVRVEPRT